MANFEEFHSVALRPSHQATISLKTSNFGFLNKLELLTIINRTLPINGSTSISYYDPVERKFLSQPIINLLEQDQSCSDKENNTTISNSTLINIQRILWEGHPLYLSIDSLFTNFTPCKVVSSELIEPGAPQKLRRICISQPRIGTQTARTLFND